MTDISKVLSLIKEDSAAAERLLPLVYDELRRLASAKLAQEKPGQTLQATALVHEAYLRLFNEDANDWNNRSHFFAAAAEAMRRILIEQARRKLAQKRGGDAQKIEIDMEQILGTTRDEKLIALDDALEKFESHDPQKAQLVKLRFFAGLTIEETAKALQLSRATVERFWTYSRAWLQREMAASP